MIYPELRVPTKAESERADKKRRAIGILQDIERIANTLHDRNLSKIKELHIEIDGTYQTVIKNWGNGMYGFIKGFGFNYDILDESSLCDNLAIMKGKLRGYMLQLDPEAEHLNKNEAKISDQKHSEYSNMYDIITKKEFNVVHEYERIWKLFNRTEHLGKVMSLSEEVDACMQFLPDKFRRRATSLADFNITYGFSFVLPNESVTMDDLVLYCEYVITLCDHLWEYAADSLEEDSDYLKEKLYQTVESCMDELGFVAAKRDNITIYVDKNPAIVSTAELVDKSLSYDIKAYNHKNMKGNLKGKKSILKDFADELEPDRQKLNDINRNWCSNLFQMLQKFVRHNNDSNPILNSMSDEETEKWYDEIYQMCILAKLMLNNTLRSKEVRKLLNQINDGKT